MRTEARHSPEAEHTVWWLLLCRAVEAAVLAKAIPPGCVVVPAEPTQAMTRAGDEKNPMSGSFSIADQLPEIYRAMIGAAQQKG